MPPQISNQRLAGRRRMAARSLSLSHRGAVGYLLQRKLIASSDVVSGTLAVNNVSRRNHVIAITRETGESYLLKQGVGADRIASLQREALVYQRLGRDSGSTDFARYLPRFYGYDSKEHVLLVQFLKDGEDLRSYCTKRHRLPTKVAAELGCALATLHRMGLPTGVQSDRRLDFERKAPWVFSHVRPELKILHRASAGSIELLTILQEFTDFSRHFDRLRAEWKAESFIHFDLRWDNCIILPPAASNGASGDAGLRIVDWEMAGCGDPRWDVGAIFANFVNVWLSGVPVTGDSPPDAYLDAAAIPLERLQPAIRAFWLSYACEMGITQAAAEAWLLRAVEYAAATLIQTAVEWVSSSAQLAGSVICLLQLSLNMLQRPKQATVDLLGIPL